MLPILSTNLCHQPTTIPNSPAILYLKSLHKPCCSMARPDAIHRDIGLDEGDINPKEKSFLDKVIDKISTKNSKDLFYGTITGWASGIVVVRVGRVAAFGLGGGVILLHVASECGYISVNWDRIKAACAQTQHCADYVVRLVRNNSCYSVGFIGGFFFGVASS